MKKESLEEAILMIVDGLEKNKKIRSIDKLELMVNIRGFLNVDKYEDNIKILSKGSNKK